MDPLRSFQVEFACRGTSTFWQVLGAWATRRRTTFPPTPRFRHTRLCIVCMARSLPPPSCLSTPALCLWPRRLQARWALFIFVDCGSGTTERWVGQGASSVAAHAFRGRSYRPRRPRIQRGCRRGRCVHAGRNCGLPSLSKHCVEPADSQPAASDCSAAAAGCSEARRRQSAAGPEAGEGRSVLGCLGCWL